RLQSTIRSSTRRTLRMIRWVAGVIILAGTRKGLFLARGGDGRWELEGPFLSGWSVFHAIVHDGVVYTASNNFVYAGSGPRSPDLGRTCERSEGLASRRPASW